MNFSSQINIGISMAKNDINLKYRRSILGPFWQSITTSIMVVCIWILFGKIFGAETSDFLPHVALGFIFWGFISGIVTDSCSSLVSSEAIIKQINIPPMVFFYRVIFRNIILVLHSLVLYPILIMIFIISDYFQSLLIL